MKIETKESKLEYAVYSAIQYLNGSSNRTTDEIYSLLLNANDYEPKHNIKSAIKEAITKGGKYKAKKVWSISKEQTMYQEEMNEVTLNIEVTCKVNKKNE